MNHMSNVAFLSNEDKGEQTKVQPFVAPSKFQSFVKGTTCTTSVPSVTVASQRSVSV